MFKHKQKKSNLYLAKDRFSIRKNRLGVASVLLGTTLFLNGILPETLVSAEEHDLDAVEETGGTGVGTTGEVPSTFAIESAEQSTSISPTNIDLDATKPSLLPGADSLTQAKESSEVIEVEAPASEESVAVSESGGLPIAPTTSPSNPEAIVNNQELVTNESLSVPISTPTPEVSQKELSVEESNLTTKEVTADISLSQSQYASDRYKQQMLEREMGLNKADVRAWDAELGEGWTNGGTVGMVKGAHIGLGGHPYLAPDNAGNYQMFESPAKNYIAKQTNRKAEDIPWEEWAPLARAAFDANANRVTEIIEPWGAFMTLSDSEYFGPKEAFAEARNFTVWVLRKGQTDWEKAGADETPVNWAAAWQGKNMWRQDEGRPNPEIRDHITTEVPHEPHLVNHFGGDRIYGIDFTDVEGIMFTVEARLHPESKKGVKVGLQMGGDHKLEKYSGQFEQPGWWPNAVLSATFPITREWKRYAIANVEGMGDWTPERALTRERFLSSNIPIPDDELSFAGEGPVTKPEVKPVPAPEDKPTPTPAPAPEVKPTPAPEVKPTPEPQPKPTTSVDDFGQLSDLSADEIKPIDDPKSYVDPAYGTKIHKVTSAQDGVAKIKDRMRHEYSRRQAFNADNSHILAQDNEGNWYLYNVAEFKMVKHLKDLVGDAEPIWNAQDPNKLYFTSRDGGLTWWELNVKTGERTVAFDMTNKSPWPEANGYWTKSEGTTSADGRYLTLLASHYDVDTKAKSAYGVVVMDLVTKQIVGQLDGKDFPTPFAYPDHVSTSPSGEFAVVSWEKGYGGTWAYNRDFTTSKQLTNGSEHSDLAINHDGQDVLIYADYDNGQIRAINLSSGESHNLHPLYPVSGESYAVHFSGQASDKPGWVVVSTYDDYDNYVVRPAKTLRPEYRKVWLMELKPNGRKLNLAHVRYVLPNDDDKFYFLEPQASASRDLSKVIFASNMDGKVESYVINLSDVTVDSQQTPTPEGKPAPTPTPTPVPDVKPVPAPEVKPVPTPVPTPDVKPAPAPEVKPVPTPTPVPDVKPVPVPEVKPTPIPAPVPDVKPAPAPEVKPAPIPAPVPDVKPTPAPEVKPTPSPAPDAKPEPVPTPDVKPTPAPSTQMVTGVKTEGKQGMMQLSSLPFVATHAATSIHFDDQTVSKRVPDEGHYIIQSDNSVAFIPEVTFTGPAKGVVLQGRTAGGEIVSTTYKPVVHAATLSGEAVRTSAPQGIVQTGKPNFVSSMALDTSKPATFVDGKTEARVTGEGLYRVASNGVVTFEPEPDFVGLTKGVTVLRQDLSGAVVLGQYIPVVTKSMAESPRDDDDRNSDALNQNKPNLLPNTVQSRPVQATPQHSQTAIVGDDDADDSRQLVTPTGNLGQFTRTSEDKVAVPSSTSKTLPHTGVSEDLIFPVAGMLLASLGLVAGRKARDEREN